MRPISRKRRVKELELFERDMVHPSHRISLRALARLNKVLALLLKLSLLEKRGRANALDIAVNDVRLSFRELPGAFDGTRLCYVSDLHLDGTNGIPVALRERLEPLQYDYLLLGGDYRYHHRGNPAGSQRHLSELLGYTVHKTPVYAVLGNHDTYETALLMDSMGVTVLMNETVFVERQGARLALTGVDDHHLYRSASFTDAARNLPEDGMKIIMSHSPAPYRKIDELGFTLCLSGHTHGGQICLPGGVPLITGTSAPGRMVKGTWRFNALTGYTSTGAGTSVYPVRFFCRPEIAVITLVKGAGI